MAEPSTKKEFADYCLRRLGAPVINIEVSNEQIDDRIQDALNYYYDYHFEGSEKTYYKHLVSIEDKQNRFIYLPENIMGPVRIFNGSTFANSYSLFDVRYQIALNDLYTLTTQSIVPYFMTMQHLSLLEQLFVGEKPLRFNRNTGRLDIDTDWDKYREGEDYLIVEATQVVDPEDYERVWSDRWLKRYATALIRRQWGENLMKFTEIPLMGGMALNGTKIYQEAVSEIEKLEDEMLNSYSGPLLVKIG